MKRAHRTFHLAMWLLIAPAVLIGLALALAARQSVPIETQEPVLSDTRGEAE